jgi:hypothetical protein
MATLIISVNLISINYCRFVHDQFAVCIHSACVEAWRHTEFDTQVFIILPEVIQHTPVDTKSHTLFARSHYTATAAAAAAASASATNKQTNKQIVYGVLKSPRKITGLISLHDTVNTEQHVNNTL